MGLLGSQAQIATADFAVPAQDSADNVDIADVIGSKLDTYSGDSLYTFGAATYKYLNTESLVYPTLATGATVVSATANWTLGAYAVVVPASTITNDFHIHNVTIESCNKNAIFELVLYKGAGADVIATIRFAVIGGFWGNSVYSIASERVEANSQVRAKLASSDGALNQATITISICYCLEY